MRPQQFLKVFFQIKWILAQIAAQGHSFLQRVIASYAMLSAVLAIVNPSVCPFVRLSQSGTVSKRLKLGSWDLHWRIAP